MVESPVFPLWPRRRKPYFATGISQHEQNNTNKGLKTHKAWQKAPQQRHPSDKWENKMKPLSFCGRAAQLSLLSTAMSGKRTLLLVLVLPSRLLLLPQQRQKLKGCVPLPIPFFGCHSRGRVDFSVKFVVIHGKFEINFRLAERIMCIYSLSGFLLVEI